jgi:hypothetical protein
MINLLVWQTRGVEVGAFVTSDTPMQHLRMMNRNLMNVEMTKGALAARL